MQNDDSQARFLREFAKIEGIEDEIKKINSGHKKLSKRVNQIEIQGLQEQLNSLNDALIETQRILARLCISYTSDYIMAATQHQKPGVPRESFNQLVADTVLARSQVNTSQKPLLLAKEFVKKSYDDAEKQGIKFIYIH
jgi:hypothetical protein